MSLVTIGRLPRLGADNSLPARFWIPAYQRGYRWRGEDVTRLLKDLQDFMNEGVRDGTQRFYCLQPLVVKRVEVKSEEGANGPIEWWEVVDGQQRLTTLYLILQHLTGEPPFKLRYETREKSEVYLHTISYDQRGANIDFHHIYHAHVAIQEWFDKHSDQKDALRHLLQSSSKDERNVRFIWYELGSGEDAVEAFTRLNVGKIRLTDEELIRALFLRNSVDGELAKNAFKHRLALEWDRIETALQDPEFWGFVSNKDAAEGGRILLMFQLNAPKDIGGGEHELYLHYEKELNGASSDKLGVAWQKIVSLFEQLDEWHREPLLFHLVGFYTTVLSGHPSTVLRQHLNDAAKMTKNAFADHLRRHIRKSLIGGVEIAEWVAGLAYHLHASRTRQALALFNIATLLRTKGVQIRFPFHLYNANTWDIEHVHSQGGDNLDDKKHQLEWLDLCAAELKAELAGDDEAEKSEAKLLLNQISHFKGGAASEPVFDDLKREIQRHFRETDPGAAGHDIGNLTLLESSMNRAYKNAPFAVKRSKLLEGERWKGAFILPCTRDLFLKVFSKKPGNLRRWDIDQDGVGHEKMIEQTLEAFFEERGGTEA